MRTQIFFRRAVIYVAFGAAIAATANAQYIYPGPSPLGWGSYLFPGPCYYYNLPNPNDFYNTLPQPRIAPVGEESAWQAQSAGTTIRSLQASERAEPARPVSRGSFTTMLPGVQDLSSFDQTTHRESAIRAAWPWSR
jgi:hypothetical protein